MSHHEIDDDVEGAIEGQGEPLCPGLTDDVEADYRDAMIATASMQLEELRKERDAALRENAHLRSRLATDENVEALEKALDNSRKELQRQLSQVITQNEGLVREVKAAEARADKLLDILHHQATESRY